MVDVVGPHLQDAYGRRLEYLRLSVTERCNFRCTYCLPGGCPAGDGRKPLSVEEIDRLVRGFAALGFWKVRITGGEPTLRRDVVGIVERVAAVPGVRHVGMTTNGYRLESLAGELARAGLTALNVSVDSLDPDRFAAITGRSLLSQVVAGVDAALAAGIPRIKVNAVLLAETGADEIDRFLGWARDTPLTIRFIELMETGCSPALYARPHLPASAIEQLLVARGWSRLPRGEGDGPAVDYGQDGHRGRIGVIAPYAEGLLPRLQPAPDLLGGDLKLCLFDDRAVPLRHLLQSDHAAVGALRDRPPRRRVEAGLAPAGRRAALGDRDPLVHRRVGGGAGARRAGRPRGSTPALRPRPLCGLRSGRADIH